MTKKLVVCSALLCFFVIISTVLPSHAEEIKATDEIKKNPALMEMLKKIELSKKILVQLQEKKMTDNIKSHQIQQMRDDLKASLTEQISRMNKDNEDYSPQNAFARFVSKKPSYVQPIYQDMFAYHQNKINSAKTERDKILSSGGSTQDAWSAFHKMSATNKIKLVQLNKELAIKHSKADPTIQNTFDENGKLPRTSE